MKIHLGYSFHGVIDYLKERKKMSYEFYIMSGIAVFVGCTWLYRKGKGAYMMVRKIRSAFKVVNINPASSLADEQYKKLAVGALYASQQGVYQNSIKDRYRL